MSRHGREARHAVLEFAARGNSLGWGGVRPDHNPPRVHAIFEIAPDGALSGR